MLLTLTSWAQIKEEIALRNKKGLPVPMIKAAVAHLMQTFDWLAKPDVGVLHGDVKPDNIIITKEGDCRLIDFGLSYKNGSMQVGFPPACFVHVWIVSRGPTVCSIFFCLIRPPVDWTGLTSYWPQKNMYIQSRWYRSPEVLLGFPATHTIDMWSVGVLIAEMFLGFAPFRGYDSFDQMQRISEILCLP